MHDQFQLLLELQHMDDQRRILALEEQKLPQRLQRYETACTQAQQELTQRQTAIAQSERQQRVLERELVEHQETIRKTQSKAYEIKTNKEYSAVLAEIASGKQRLEALEDQLLTLMETADQQRQAYQFQEQSIQAARQELAAQRQQVQEAQALLQRDMALAQERRQQTMSRLDVKFYEQYQKVAAQHGGQGVAQLRDGVCSGCHLKVHPQLISEIRLQTQLFRCPHYRLLLLWPA